MDHVAILNKQWKIIPKLLNRQKTIESRWLKNRSAPWDRVRAGDVVYFKEAGEPVTLRAEVSGVEQYESLTSEKIKEIISLYGGEGKIFLNNPDNLDWFLPKRYCILIFIKNVSEIDPFHIDKLGYGTGAAWMCVGDINAVKKI
ncbi:hypothetical protein KC571_00025 [candidate division WWE3 bacterium]|uniref:ASCH domain-containing protein n=1 Tax=candidate division WWE3 bacterium TaxID=2053526 RepID=A0A955RPQ7_UNCKA|nr:hypothetical protein [candidate division WWE3 bacterium]